MYTKSIDFTLTSGSSALTGTTSDVVALFADIRGFSNWCKSASLDHVGEVIKTQYERVIQVCNDHHHCFHKFLGDGFLLLWEADENMNTNLCLQHALDAAFHIHRKYWYFARDVTFKVPKGYGIGISMGPAIRIQPETFVKEMNEVDFLGYPLNCAARMQTLSGPFGVTICSAAAKQIEKTPDDFLHENDPGFRRALLAPSAKAIEKVKLANGLQPKNKKGFRHLVWPDSPAELWNADGCL